MLRNSLATQPLKKRVNNLFIGKFRRQYLFNCIIKIHKAIRNDTMTSDAHIHTYTHSHVYLIENPDKKNVCRCVRMIIIIETVFRYTLRNSNSVTINQCKASDKLS